MTLSEERAVIDFEATYDATDDKLRLRASSRLDAETYAKVKTAGFGWAPKQDLFYAVWTPSREDLLTELAGDIDDEETSLEERAAARAERFATYQGKRAADAEQAHRAVACIANGIPLGQPILVGHHSERHARRDADRIESGMRRAVKLWETSQYWQDRASGAIRHAEYKELPAVRARRIKKLEAERRSHDRDLKSSTAFLALWKKLDQDDSIHKSGGGASTFQERVTHVAGLDRSSTGLWSKIESGAMTPAEAQARYIANHEKIIAEANRWISHLDNRLTYERALLAASGYQPPPRKSQKTALPLLNYAGMVSVRDCRQNEPRTTEAVGITKAEWAKLHTDYKGTCVSADGTHRLRTAMLNRPDRAAGLSVVYLTDSKQHARPNATTVKAQAAKDEAARESLLARKIDEARERLMASEARKSIHRQKSEEAAPFVALKETLKTGVKVVSAPQLFPTPPALAVRMAMLADIKDNDRVLEPSAGTGNLLRAIIDMQPMANVFAVEINRTLCDGLPASLLSSGEAICQDFLTCTTENLGRYDKILMNPPFHKGEDIAHVKHALSFLERDGVLVALCANGPRQQTELRPLATMWEELPAGTFSDQGTQVRTALMIVRR
jgi:methylase of polypeptide subunit release factors